MGLLQDLREVSKVLKALRDSVVEASKEVTKYRKAGTNGQDRAKAVVALGKVVSDIEFSASHLRVEFDHLAGKKDKYEKGED